MSTDQNNFRERYRAISWWLTYDDFRWPDLDIADKIRWKADNMAKNGVNMAIIFGAHWRWDWMPVWTMLHDLIATMADELHQRNIKLFDHHSAVLAQRIIRTTGLDPRRAHRQTAELRLTSRTANNSRSTATAVRTISYSSALIPASSAQT